MKETEIGSLTPEQLLQSLEAKIAFSRARRQGGRRNRALFLTIGVLCILIGAGVALLVLSQMLHGMPHAAQTERVASRP